MGVYSPARRRLIIGLLLTSVLLLAIDVQGNSIIDQGRDAFRVVLDPLESGAEVVSRPIRNAWRGITDYDELAEENEELRRSLEGQAADQITARAYIELYRDLLRLNTLPSVTDYDTIVAQVVGKAPTNLDQIIEINRGSDDGIKVGMAVVSEGGLVGKVTAPVLSDRSFVMLVTDTRYAVEAQVLGVAPLPSEGGQPSTGPGNAIPNDAISTTSTTTTTLPTSTTLPDAVPASDLPTSTTTTTTASTAPVSSAPGSSSPGTTAPTSTTSTTLPPIGRDTGLVEGVGRGERPQMRFVKEDLTVGRYRVGDVVLTQGGKESLAPPDIPLGTVARIVHRSGSAGPILEIKLSADLDRLNFVNVVFYQPPSEANPAEVAD